jgi:hypothetical protein
LRLINRLINRLFNRDHQAFGVHQPERGLYRSSRSVGLTHEAAEDMFDTLHAARECLRRRYIEFDCARRMKRNPGRAFDA